MPKKEVYRRYVKIALAIAERILAKEQAQRIEGQEVAG